MTATVQFGALPMPVVEQVVEKMVQELEARLKKQNISVVLEPAARRWLAEKGYDEAYGARPIHRLIETEVSHKLSYEILFGKLKDGRQVVIGCGPDGLTFSY